MGDERIVDQPEPIPDQELDSAAGGSAALQEALAKAKALAEMLSNLEKARSDISQDMVRNFRS